MSLGSSSTRLLSNNRLHSRSASASPLPSNRHYLVRRPSVFVSVLVASSTFTEVLSLRSHHTPTLLLAVKALVAPFRAFVCRDRPRLRLRSKSLQSNLVALANRFATVRLPSRSVHSPSLHGLINLGQSAPIVQLTADIFAFPQTVLP